MDNIILRPAHDDDAEFLFTLRNDPVVRKTSFNKSYILWNDHLKWFKSKVNVIGVLILIAEYNDQKVGQVRIERDETGVNGDVAIAIAKKFRGNGFAEAMLKNGCERFFRDNSTVIKLNAYIKESNPLSLRAFLKAGFSDIQEVFVYNHRCFKVSLTRTCAQSE